MDWQSLLAYMTGTVKQAFLLRNASLVTENRLLGNRCLAVSGYRERLGGLLQDSTREAA